MVKEKILDEIKRANLKRREEIASENEKLFIVPNFLDKTEKQVYVEIIATLKKSISYRLEETDLELIWQYCMLKIMRDTAWKLWKDNPEKYVRIVTGIASDGKTPKITVKENEHYKILGESNKQLEKILKDLRLTPDIRIKR